MTGGLGIGRPDGELVTGMIESARLNDLSYRLLSASDMSRAHPQHRLGASNVAVLEEGAGFLRPERSVAAAAARAEALGARLLQETIVLSVAATGSGVSIETSRGRFGDDHPLITAGTWTPTLTSELGLPLKEERQVLSWLAVDDPSSFAPERFPVFIPQVAPGRFRYGFPSTTGP